MWHYNGLREMVIFTITKKCSKNDGLREEKLPKARLTDTEVLARPEQGQGHVAQVPQGQHHHHQRAAATSQKITCCPAKPKQLAEKQIPCERITQAQQDPPTRAVRLTALQY